MIIAFNQPSLPQQHRRLAAVIKQNPIAFSSSHQTGLKLWVPISAVKPRHSLHHQTGSSAIRRISPLPSSSSLPNLVPLLISLYLRKRNDKVIWDDDTTEVFIHAIVDHIYAHERREISFSKEGWNAIVASFNEKAGKAYDRKQLKNRFDILRKDLKMWDMLLNKTGLGVDPRTKVLNVTRDWW